MGDVVDAATRSRIMASIRGKDTRPEFLIRRGLHALGFRYRLHARNLPGRPDLVFARRRAVVFVNGCFWHGHHCHLFRLPGTRREFWAQKIARNAERDGEAAQRLREQAWRVMSVWECAIRGRTAIGLEATVATVAAWLDGDEPIGNIEGRNGDG
ncbi:very short patch repair endonuclease [Methylopila sp. M107]|uniref:very short patch repair endonuclease n=1 Tax=Methylopila sp. M107 TaxID=1101190 RepID=UPI000372C54D|nr:very short patch repair endonuclease [Methylopila sp. M107]